MSSPDKRDVATTCEGAHGKRHRPRPMTLIGLEDDGAHIWRCPRCLYVWRERPEIVAMSRERKA